MPMQDDCQTIKAKLIFANLKSNSVIVTNEVLIKLEAKKINAHKEISGHLSWFYEEHSRSTYIWLHARASCEIKITRVFLHFIY